jgi:hypothetical protein
LKNRNFKNDVTSALSSGYKYKNIRKMSGFQGKFWVKKGRLFDVSAGGTRV